MNKDEIKKMADNYAKKQYRAIGWFVDQMDNMLLDMTGHPENTEYARCLVNSNYDYRCCVLELLGLPMSEAEKAIWDKMKGEEP